MPQDSAKAFNQCVMGQLCASTPLNETINGVRICIVAGCPRYSQCCVHRLLRDELLRALEVLEDLFSQATPLRSSRAHWSLQAGVHVLYEGCTNIVCATLIIIVKKVVRHKCVNAEQSTNL